MGEKITILLNGRKSSQSKLRKIKFETLRVFYSLRSSYNYHNKQGFFTLKKIYLIVSNVEALSFSVR